MRWGLIPWWWKKPLKQVPASFNARAETVADKPMFRDAFKRNRCVIPASGYYEWLKRPDGRQPYYITATGGSVLSFAGLYDRWKNPETGERMHDHRHRCERADAADSRPHAGGARRGRWLRGEGGPELLRPAPEDRLRMWPVSRRVNKTGTGDDDPTLLNEVAA
jgi:putative SOS response-associated peptidase YedK